VHKIYGLSYRQVPKTSAPQGLYRLSERLIESVLQLILWDRQIHALQVSKDRSREPTIITLKDSSKKLWIAEKRRLSNVE